MTKVSQRHLLVRIIYCCKLQKLQGTLPLRRKIRRSTMVSEETLSGCTRGCRWCTSWDCRRLASTTLSSRDRTKIVLDDFSRSYSRVALFVSFRLPRPLISRKARRKAQTRKKSFSKLTPLKSPHPRYLAKSWNGDVLRPRGSLGPPLRQKLSTRRSSKNSVL